MMFEVCGDNRFEIIAEYKKRLIEGTNIESRPEEMAVIDSVLFRFWQMGWIPAADVEPKHRWIPTTEDVPHIKEGCAGAVVVNAVYWAIGKYISMPLRYVRKKIRNKLVERWEYMDGSIIHKSVLYWMPLPEPPKEGQTDE